MAVPLIQAQRALTLPVALAPPRSLPYLPGLRRASSRYTYSEALASVFKIQESTFVRPLFVRSFGRKPIPAHRVRASRHTLHRCVISDIKRALPEFQSLRACGCRAHTGWRCDALSPRSRWSLPHRVGPVHCREGTACCAFVSGCCAFVTDSAAAGCISLGNEASTARILDSSVCASSSL